MSRDLGARYPRERRTYPITPPQIVRKEDCPGCVALVDDLGRFHPGDCGPACARRAARKAHR